MSEISRGDTTIYVIWLLLTYLTGMLISYFTTRFPAILRVMVFLAGLLFKSFFLTAHPRCLLRQCMIFDDTHDWGGLAKGTFQRLGELMSSCVIFYYWGDRYTLRFLDGV